MSSTTDPLCAQCGRESPPSWDKGCLRPNPRVAPRARTDPRRSADRNAYRLEAPRKVRTVPARHPTPGSGAARAPPASAELATEHRPFQRWMVPQVDVEHEVQLGKGVPRHRGIAHVQKVSRLAHASLHRIRLARDARLPNRIGVRPVRPPREQRMRVAPQLLLHNFRMELRVIQQGRLGKAVERAIYVTSIFVEPR